MYDLYARRIQYPAPCNELRDLEAELLDMVCNDVTIEPVLQDISGEQLGRGSNIVMDARLDIHHTNFYTLSVHIYWWDGQGVFAFP